MCVTTDFSKLTIRALNMRIEFIVGPPLADEQHQSVHDVAVIRLARVREGRREGSGPVLTAGGQVAALQTALLPQV